MPLASFPHAAQLRSRFRYSPADAHATSGSDMPLNRSRGGPPYVHLPSAKPFQLSITAHRDISLPVNLTNAQDILTPHAFSCRSPHPVYSCALSNFAQPLSCPSAEASFHHCQSAIPHDMQAEKERGKIAGRAHHAFELRDSFRKIEMQIRAFDDSLNVRAPAKPCALSPSPPGPPGEGILMLKQHTHVQACPPKLVVETARQWRRG